jgi:hypothetical protein
MGKFTSESLNLNNDAGRKLGSGSPAPRLSLEAGNAARGQIACAIC